MHDSRDLEGIPKVVIIASWLGNMVRLHLIGLSKFSNALGISIDGALFHFFYLTLTPALLSGSRTRLRSAVLGLADMVRRKVVRGLLAVATPYLIMAFRIVMKIWIPGVTAFLLFSLTWLKCWREQSGSVTLTIIQPVQADVYTFRGWRIGALG